MEYKSIKETILSRFIAGVICARGALVFEARAILVTTFETDIIVSLIDVTRTFAVIGEWRITEGIDIAEAIRALKRIDTYLSGCVFLDDGASCTLVDDATLLPTQLFGRERRIVYGTMMK